MQTTVKKLPKSQVLLTIVLDPAEWEKYRVQALRKLSGQVSLSGFRKGHVPEKVLLEHLGTGTIQAETVEIALPQSYVAALQEHKIEPIAQPEVKITSQEPFTFEATVAVMPEISVKPLKNFKPDHSEITVSEKEIDEMVEYFREQVAERKPVEHSAKKGNIVTIDFSGFDQDGVALEQVQGKGHPVEIGSKTMIPGFEDELTGVKTGEKKSFTLTFPKEYHNKKFAGKKVRFEINVLTVEEKVLPEINEAFVEKLTGNKKSVDNLKKEITEALKERKTREQQQANETKLLEAVEKAVEVDLPEILITEEVEYLIDNLKMQGLQRGITWENHLLHLKKSEEDLRKEVRSQAEKQVRTRLGVQKFLQQEPGEVPDEEVNSAAQGMLARMSAEERQKQHDAFQKGGRGWEQEYNKLRVQKWISQKIAEHK